MGATGATGTTGATGATGPQGASGKSGESRLTKIAAGVKNVVAILLAGIAAFYLLMVIAVNLLVRVPCMKQFCWTRGLLRWILRASMSIEALKDTTLDERVGPAVTGLVRSRCQYPRGRLGLDNVGGQAAVANTMSAFKDFAGTNTAFAFIGFLYALWPRQRFVLSGELLPAGPLGPGINLALYAKGLPDSVVTLWAGEYGIDVEHDAGTAKDGKEETGSATSEKTPSEGEMYAYERLATVAGAWVDYRLMQALGERGLSTRWRSWVLLRAGLDQHRLGKHEQARELYEQALSHDGKNAGALANLGILERRAQKFERAELLLSEAVRILGDKPLYKWRRRNAKDACACVYSGDLFAAQYQLAAMHLARAESPEKTSKDRGEARSLAETLVTDGLSAWTALEAMRGARLGRSLWDECRRCYRRRRCCRCNSTTARAELEDFLRTTIIPSAMVLVAGAQLQQRRNRKRPKRYDKQPPTTAPPSELYRQTLETHGRSGGSNPWPLVVCVEHQKTELAPRVFYNLACFYARAQDEPKAREALESTMLRTAVADRVELLEVIEEDPTLRAVSDEKSFIDDLRTHIPASLRSPPIHRTPAKVGKDRKGEAAPPVT